MSFRTFVNKKIVYHSTSIDRLPSIKKNGLKTNSMPNHTQAGDWALEYYKINPIYVSFDKGKYEGIILQIDATNIDLYCDLPSLIDKGAIITDNDTLYFENGNEYNIYDLLDPLSNECKEMISFTGTAAILQNIPVDRITIL